MPGIIELAPATFDETVERPGIVLVDAWAPWCGACRQFAPVFAQAAAAYPQHTFAKLDTAAHAALCASLHIVNVPTVLIYRDGIQLYNRAGAPAAEVLADLIAQVAALDMDVVRADIAAEKD